MTSRSASRLSASLSAALALPLPIAFAFAGCGNDDSSTPPASVDGGADVGSDGTVSTFSVSGTVSGLASGEQLGLSDGYGDEIFVSSNGAFVFPAVATGTSYTVVVASQPSSPQQICTVANGAGTIGSVPVSNVQVTCSTSSFTVGGTVTGLLGTGLVLEDNLGDDLPVAVGDGGTSAFTFAAPVASGAAYSVTVKTQPGTPAQVCVVTGGSGTISATNVTGVTITCDVAYPVNVSVTGLSAGATLVLQDKGGDNLTFTANGTQSFATLVARGTAYVVTVLTQPITPPELCTVTSSGHTISPIQSNDVSVACTLAYFVDVTKGADTNAGTPAAPWKTITHAIATLPAAGGSIVVAPGTYNAASGEVFPLEPRSNQAFVGDIANLGVGATPTLITGSGPYTISGSTVVNGAAIAIPQGVTSVSLGGFALTGTGQVDVFCDGATATLASNTMIGGTTSQVAVFGGGQATLSGNNVSGGAANAELSGGRSAIRARGNTFAAATEVTFALLNSQTGTPDGSNVDFGTAADPGMNTFTSGPSSFGFDMTAAVGVVLAAGNTWNANVQGADGSGHYAPALVNGPVTGVAGGNYALVTGASIQF